MVEPDEPKRITGFMAFAREIIKDEPGLTAQEVYGWVEQYESDEGVKLSASPNPKQSLISTLHKTYRDFGLERRKGKDGKNRFFPAGHPEAEQPPFRLPSLVLADSMVEPPGEKPTKDGTDHSNDDCCITLPKAESEKIRALVTLGKYTDEHAAYQDLVRRGLEAVLATL